MASAQQGAFLIVNADDYGYFRCVSQGILRSAEQGIVTATGVFANAPDFDEHAAWLRDFGSLDVGVHLNLTTGDPLTNAIRAKLARWAGKFAGKVQMAMAVLARTVSVEDVRREWQAQIERCLASGLRPVFLNSHEHMHMLPALYPVASALANDHDIPHLRFPDSQIGRGTSAAALLRGVVMQALGTMNRRHVGAEHVRFLGLEASGKLGLRYLEHVIPQLRAGEVYELMCHPGLFDANEIHDARLVAYHDWEGELRTLTSLATRELLRRHSIQVIGYRHLERLSGQRIVAPAASPHAR